MEFDTSRLTNNVSADTDAQASKITQSIRTGRGSASAADGITGNQLNVAEGAKAEGIVQQMTTVIIESDHDYYFALEVYDAEGRPLVDAALDPGGMYVVRARASLNPVTGQKQTRKLEVQATLELKVPDGCVDVENPSGVLMAKKPFSQSIDFKLTVRADCALHSLPLDLEFYETSLPSQRAVVTSRELFVNVTNVTKRFASKTLGLQLSGDAPPGTGFCYIQALSDKMLKLLFFLNKEKPETFQMERLPTASPPTGSLDEYLRYVYDSAMKYFADQSSTMANWLGTKIAGAPGPLSIILVDDADSRIPWELAPLTPKGRLGSEVRCIRVLQKQYRDESKPLDFSEQHLVGQARQLLSPQSSAFEGWATSIEDCKELLDALDLDPPVSLVCIAVDSLVQAGALPPDFDALWYPSKNRFEVGFGVGADPPQRPLFLIPSPHSGWTLGRGKDATGLPPALLEKAGTAVIGSLGPLDPQDALEIAKQLFEIAKKQEGLHPAEAIRQLRLEAEKEIALSKNKQLVLQKRKALFRGAITKLLLVYYGPPNLKVCLQPLPASNKSNDNGGN